MRSRKELRSHRYLSLALAATIAALGFALGHRREMARWRRAHPRVNAPAGEWSHGRCLLFGAPLAHCRCVLCLTLCSLAVSRNENEWLAFLRCGREAVLFSRDACSAVWLRWTAKVFWTILGPGGCAVYRPRLSLQPGACSWSWTGLPLSFF
jgi:hypothetical protein